MKIKQYIEDEKAKNFEDYDAPRTIRVVPLQSLVSRSDQRPVNNYEMLRQFDRESHNQFMSSRYE